MASSRQLAAIMFTDIVGYTAMMGKNEEKTLNLVRQCKAIQQPLVEKHKGKWLKEMGDGVMAQFSSALDAVNCALEIQRTSRADFDGDIRIGIHLGDITIENNDAYGDGVNVASRLESIADPGGIYISESIEKAIQGQTEIQAKYLGEVKLKNVAYGVRTYAIQGVGLPVPKVDQEKQLSGHFWAELQRRGVIRAGTSYIMVSVILLLLLPYGAALLPEWTTTVLYTILLIGFPVSMYFAWTYERSPQGFVRTTSSKSWQNPYSAAQRKPLTGRFIIAALTLLVIVMYLYPRVGSVQPKQETTESTLEAAVRDNSIAILPFADMSPNKDQEYFSDGMMEEILNHLVKIEDLQVTSRTSVMQYKGTTKTIGEIAKELRVATILQGSVRKAGNTVRITVQLIDTRTDQHLWSETFDRNLDHVFAIQSDVAQKIALSLQAQVRPEVKLRIETQPTFSIEAYDLYLEANSIPFVGEGRQKAIELLEKVIHIDPEFADAYVELGSRKSWYGFSGPRLVSNTEEALETSIYYNNKALELDPYNSSAHGHLGDAMLWYGWDFESAEKEYQLQSQLNAIGAGMIDFLISSGQFEEAVEKSRILVQTNPTSPNAWSKKILSLYFNGQSEESLKTIASVPFPKNGLVPMETARVFIYLSMYKQAIEVLSQMDKFPRSMGLLSIAYFHEGEQAKFDEQFQELISKSEESPAGSPSFYIAMVYAQMGEIDTSFKWLDKSYED
ncbi:MAG: hypothetical protein O6939_10480, partial [Bacteroidetes bacterium]|nr:hypothetical protein [Bacteroidota bacterium]